MKILICCIGKNENQYIREYVEWYKNLGVRNICLYDNNDIDGEHFEDVISDYIDEGYVILNDFRGRKVCQLDSYNECYSKYKDDYDWICFFDCDEFLTLKKDKTISDYLNRIIFKKYDMIHVNWMNYGDSELVCNDKRNLNERFTKPCEFDYKCSYNFPENFHVKSIIRGIGRRFNGNISFSGNSHTPTNATINCCNSSGFKCDSKLPVLPYNYSDAYLKHFSTKTAEEYCDKMKRGFPDQLWDGSRVKNLICTRFFKTNEITKEKIDVFKEKLGIDMSYLLIEEESKQTDVKKKDYAKIFSLCFSDKNFEFINDSVITPLQVGADYSKLDVCPLKDNTGENISAANYFFIENTGTFWIWKNVHDVKYKGQMQYRRPLSGVNENMDFDDVFSKYKVITCEPFHHPDHKKPTQEEPRVIPADTVEQGYAFSNCIVDIKVLEEVIKNEFPGYIDAYEKYIKRGPDLYYSNGFILPEEKYDEYCEFLFSVLREWLKYANISSETDLWFYVGKSVGAGKYVRYGENAFAITPEMIRWNTRIGGFLSERIWTLWLLRNYKKEDILELPYIKQEEGMYT